MAGFFVSDTLPKLLAERGWTQERLGDATGIARTDINLLCRGKKRLGLVRARRIADALGVSLLELGAPDPLATDAASHDLRDRLAALEAGLASADSERRDLVQLVAELTVRLERLEALASSAEGKAGT